MSKNLKEKIEKNKKKLYSTNEKYKIFTKELLGFLGDGFIGAPASTMKSLHNAFPGGLIDHIILTTKYGVGIIGERGDNMACARIGNQACETFFALVQDVTKFVLGSGET